MAVAIKQQKSAAKVATTQLDVVLQRRQLLNVLDYVLSNLYEQNIKNDSRIEAYKQFEAAKNAEHVNTLKEDFCAMFGSRNFGLVNENDPLCAKKKPTGGEKTTGGISTTSSNQNTGLYKPAKAPYQLTINNQTYKVSIWPSAAYPNLNALPKKALLGYLYYLGLSKENARQLASVIKDWVDEDDFTDEGGGAEWSAYNQRTQPYKPRNGPIKNWQELNYLLRANPDMVNLLRQHFVLQGAEKVHTDYLNNNQIAALSGIPQTVVEKWQLQKKQELITKIDSKAQQSIDAVVDNQTSTDDIVIKIGNEKNQLTAWFNIKERKLQDWSFSQDMPATLPLHLDVITDQSS